MNDVSWQVAMLGPSRVGKTSLMTSLQVAAQDFFARTPVTVLPVDAVTRAAFRANNDRMLGELAALKFSPDSLPGTPDLHRYGLAVDPGVDDLAERQVLTFVDYPGGWISDAEHEDVVEEVLANSPAVIIPLDATLIMESRKATLPDVARILEITAVAEHVRKWASKRTAEGDPTLLILAPVKCESYFKDNGGAVDRSEDLFNGVRNLYYPVVDAYRAEVTDGAPVLYAPVDTIGPVELKDAEWQVDSATGQRRLWTEFKVRTDRNLSVPPRSVKGAQPILGHLVEGILNLRDAAMRDALTEQQAKKHETAREGKRKRSSWWRRIADDWSGAKDRRKEKSKAQQARIDKLEHGLRALAKNVRSATKDADWDRVREW